MNGNADAQRLWSPELAGQAMAPLRVEVSATTVVLGALATRDYAPMHHDHAYATQTSGTRDIFLNTPHQAAFLERYLTDWSGPKGRLGYAPSSAHLTMLCLSISLYTQCPVYKLKTRHWKDANRWVRFLRQVFGFFH